MLHTLLTSYVVVSIGLMGGWLYITDRYIALQDCREGWFRFGYALRKENVNEPVHNVRRALWVTLALAPGINLAATLALFGCVIVAWVNKLKGAKYVMWH